MSGNCLCFICIIYCAFVWSIYQIVVIFSVKRKNKKEDRHWGRIFNECQWWVWKEPMIGDKSLSCGAVVTTERHLDVCVTPRPCALLTTCTVCPLPHTGLYFRKTSAINPSICASMTFHPCACESVCFRETSMCFFFFFCRWIEITKMRPIRLEVQNVFEDKTSTRQIMMGD